MILFEKGRTKTGGRAKGVRNKRSKQFDDDLWAFYQNFGPKCFEIVMAEKKNGPLELLKLVAARLPVDGDASDYTLKELSDDELRAIKELAQRLVPRARDSDGDERGESAIN
jgi:hypothetical protein